MYRREGWGCPVCGVIYWAMPLMKTDIRCDKEWVKVTVKHDDVGELVDEVWHYEETWSRVNRDE